MGPNPVGPVSLEEEGNLDTDILLEGRWSGDNEAKVGAALPQAKEPKGGWQSPEARGGKDGSSRRASRRSMILPTPSFQTVASRTVKESIAVVSSHSL